MASKTDTTIFYQEQIEICKRHFNPEQFGRLMYALFEVDEGKDPQVDEDIAVAFEFMAHQKRLDREKYEKKCETNRKNGKLGGRPKKNPEKPNGFFENPNKNNNKNKNKNKNENKNVNDNESHTDGFYGRFENVALTGQEYFSLKEEFEKTTDLINKVSVWLRQTGNEVEDHYALCLKFAESDDWPKRRRIEPVEQIEVTDPIAPEEQEAMVRDMKKRLGGLF